MKIRNIRISTASAGILLMLFIVGFMLMPLTASAEVNLKIKSKLDLDNFFTICRADPSACATLENDITIDSDWATHSISSSDKDYIGTFDGNGYTITVKGDSSPLFYTIGDEGKIKDLSVVVSNIDTPYSGGSLATSNKGVISNCTVECGNITAKEKTLSGAFAGRNRGTIEDSTAIINGSVMNETSSATCGGIVGYNNENAKILRCTVRGNGSIKTSTGMSVGGITGTNWRGGTVSGCIVEGNISIIADATPSGNKACLAGGIVASSYGTVENCLVYGNVIIKGNTYSGGIVSFQRAGKIKHCFYNSNNYIRGPGSYAHPIVGKVDGGKGEGCFYNGTIGQTDDRGLGISRFYWVRTAYNVKLPDEADIPTGDALVFAGRYFYYFYRSIPVKYTGIKFPGQEPAYIVEGNGTSDEVHYDEIIMPDYEITISAVLKPSISRLSPSVGPETTFTYDGTPKKPDVRFAVGSPSEGTDYTVIFKDDEGKKVAECINGGTYTMSVWGAGDYSGHVDFTFTIKKATPSFEVTADDVKDGQDINDIVFKRTDESAPGTIRLTETRLICGTGTYHWTFIPENEKNYESISGEVEITADHFWGVWQVTKEPTPVRTGIRERVCLRDHSHKQSEVISTSGKLLPKMTSKGKRSLVITWNKVRDADGYDIYFARCNHKNKKNICKKIKTIKAGNKLKYTKTKLRTKTSYKAFIMVYKIVDGVKIYTDTSFIMHTYTSGKSGSRTNPAKVSVKKSKFTLEVGKTAKIKGKVIKPKKNRKLKISRHTPQLRYISSLKDVATVSKDGKIKAENKGTCKIYAIAVNGVKKAITVTVK